jgi:hypothetical protein
VKGIGDVQRLDTRAKDLAAEGRTCHC